MSEVSERLAEVLAEHRVNYHHRNVGPEPVTADNLRYTSCDGCAWLGGHRDEAGWEAHVAEVQAERVEQMLAEARAEALREAADGPASFMEPWGPFEMGGFEGCTDRDPEHCACATDEQPTCHDCGQEIEPGEKAWSRQWPCYETLPLSHRDQDWDVISWHDSCPDLRADAAEREAR